MTEEQLSALLRLKRHELPPPGYFDDLLHQVQHRQRTELLRRPLWRIALERWQTFFGEHSMGTYSYAGAMAGVVLAGLLVVSILPAGVGGPGGSGGAVAQNTPGPVESAAPVAPLVSPKLDWNSPQLSSQPYVQHVQAAQPRYIIDARPLVYHERPASF